jgi:hypothetical protein
MVSRLTDFASMRSAADILYNFHWVVPGEAARSAQAYARLLTPFLRARRIRAVINLRGDNPRFSWWRYEKRVCRALGIAHFDVGVNSRTLPARQTLIALVDAFDAAERPFLIKCSGGQDRTSFAAALYIIHRFGWTAFPRAQAQFARWPYLHLPKRMQRWARLFFIYAHEAAGEHPLQDWIRREYEPELFMAWLDSRGAPDSFRNLPGQGPRNWKAASAIADLPIDDRAA